MPRWLPTALVAVGIVLGIAGLGWTLRHAMQVPADVVMVDYHLYALAAKTLIEGGDPYAYREVSGDGLVLYGYVYPPIVAWAIAPLAVLPWFRVGYLAWFAICAASLTASLVVLLRAYRRPVPWWLIAPIVGAAFTTFLVRENLYHGQLDVILLLCATVGLWLLMRGRQMPAGVLIGLAASGKPFLGILLLLLLWRGQYRAAGSMILTGVLALVIGFLPTLGNGTAVIESWIGASRYASSPAFAAFPANHALSALLLRLFTQTPFADPLTESRALLYLGQGLILAVIAVAWIMAVPRGSSTLEDRDSDLIATPGLLLFVEGGLLLCLLYSFGPLTEGNHLFMLLPGVVGSMRLALGSPNRSVRRRWMPAAVAWAVLLVAICGPLMHLTWVQPIEQHLSGLTVLWTGRLGILLLAVALVTAWSRWREARASGAPSTS